MGDWLYNIWSELTNPEKYFVLFVSVILIGYNINEKFKIFNRFFNYIKNLFTNKKPDNEEIIVNRKKTKQEIDSMVINHELMILIKRIETELCTKNFGSPKKNKIFQFVLKTHIDTIKEKFENFVDKYDVDNVEKTKFKKLLFDLLSDIISETDNKLKLKLGKGIYNLIILDPIKGFRKWEESNNKLEWGILNDIDWDKYLEYMNYNHKLLVFIMATKYVTLEVLSDGYEKRFSNFNGELDKLIEDYNEWN